MNYLKAIVLITSVLFLMSVSFATIINVPDNYPTIQQGIDSSSDGDTVLVQPGTYYENINFNGHKCVLGSMCLTTTDSSYISQTIIDGDSSGSVITFESGEDSTTVILGFTIQSGYSGSGGGIDCVNSSPKILFNYIRDNIINGIWGAGIHCSNSSSVILSNRITNNWVDNGSSGAAYGAGICSENSNLVIQNNIIFANTASAAFWSEGAGIYCVNSHVLITNNVICDNHSYAVNGAGAGGIAGYNSYVMILNTIIRGNTNDYENCQVFGNWDLFYSNIEDGYEGEGNIDIDPLFRDPENGDFHLMATYCGDPYDSPCIDMGKPSILDTLLDCSWGLGTERSDMGAYAGGEGTVGIDDPVAQIPETILLSQNYPNPFNASTIIRYELPQQSQVTLDIYDILGRQVITLEDGIKTAGSHQVIWQAEDISSGVYFYKIQAGEYVETQKMMLVK